LTELVRTYPENDEIIKKWVEGVFPLILDVEQKAADKVQEVSQRVLSLRLFNGVELKGVSLILILDLEQKAADKVQEVSQCVLSLRLLNIFRLMGVSLL
jgi:hypothetical protein